MGRLAIYLGSAVLAVLAIGLLVFRPWNQPEFALSGPEASSRMAVATPADMAHYERGGPNRVAVLVTDPGADWLGLARGFTAHGIPFIITEDPARALRHDVVLAYPIISGRVLNQDALRDLAAHVHGGGTLLTFNLAGGGLQSLFGIVDQQGGRERAIMEWTQGALAGERGRFNSPRAEARVGSFVIRPSTATSHAIYGDGSAAATCRTAAGTACILGVDLGSLTQRAMNGRSEQVSDRPVNSYDPTLDLFYRWIAELYVAGEPDAFLIDTARAGTTGSLVLTHDVDFSRSVLNIPAYAEAIRQRGREATFFVQTKYVRDWNDDAFLNQGSLSALRQAAAAMEIGSHSVSHSLEFARFPLGNGEETYPDYEPFVASAEETRDGTILGELRVSRYLLEELAGQPVRSFRPGYLANPAQLPEALQATGYRYSSNMTANLAMTHLPFRLARGRANSALVPVWEFPVTIEDERDGKLGDRFDDAVSVIDRIADHRGVAVILIHPDITGHKLDFETRLIDHYADRLWIGSLGALGAWWEARSRAQFDFDGTELTIDAPQRIDDLVIRFPNSGRTVTLQGVEGTQVRGFDEG